MTGGIISDGAVELSFMASVYAWGIAVIKLLQRIETPELTQAVRYLTHLGLGYLYFPLILLIFWCIDEKQGMRLGVLLLISTWISAAAKDFFKEPRPYQLDASVGRAFETSYGFPSGHAQLSLTFLLPLALWLGETKQRGTGVRVTLAVLALFLCLVIGWTRLYLGVHFPTDVLAGWFVGALLITGFRVLSPCAERLLAEEGLRFQLICISLITWLILLSGTDRALAGLFFGFTAGFCLLRGSFSAYVVTASGTSAYFLRGMRYLLGISGAAVVYAALKLALPGISPLYDAGLLPFNAGSYTGIVRFVHYGAAGLWMGAGAPALFNRLLKPSYLR